MEKNAIQAPSRRAPRESFHAGHDGGNPPADPQMSDFGLQPHCPRMEKRSGCIDSSADRGHQNLSCAAVDVHQSFTGQAGSHQGLG